MADHTHRMIMIVLAIAAIVVPVALMAVTGVFSMASNVAVMQQVVSINSGLIRDIRVDVNDIKKTTDQLKLDLRVHEAANNINKKPK